MRDSKEYIILDAASVEKAGKIIDVEDFSNAVITIATDGGSDAALTLKMAGAISEDAPNFDGAATVENMFSYIQMINLEDGQPVDGNEGITFAGDDYSTFELNINALKWITGIVSSRTNGEVTVKIKLFNNQ